MRRGGGCAGGGEVGERRNFWICGTGGLEEGLGGWPCWMRRKGDGKGPRLSMTGYGWLVKGLNGEEGMRGEKSGEWKQEVDEKADFGSGFANWARWGEGDAVLQGASGAVKGQGR